ncbi:hypothetical protein BV25DRAFT_1913851 [Artomyces pyxidatus]|uniref:Uncharacterized protein n=1 Tax=Artomyces pyxidatus TaxID=48021 RepID=A0ACB8T9Q1_9AGAM|nr:hypothetical protein BV25DRAFT_1913851 [Artomyces pyxidatus]
MFSSRLTSFAALSALVSSAVASFQVLSPGGPNLWWVAQSENVIAWSCHDNPPATVFQLLLANGNPDILVNPMAIVANIQNADCSHTITQQQTNLVPATNYTLIISDALDQTHVYATSQPFEVKALGATYPDPSATPVDNGPSSTTPGGASSTASSSGSASPTSGAKSNGAAALQVPVGALAVAFAAIGLL